MLNNQILRLMGLGLMLVMSAACAPAPTVSSAPNPQPIAPLATEVSRSPADAPACEEYFGFCVTATLRGAVTTTATAGVGSSANTHCTAWAASGAPRLLELPLMLAAGDGKITVALTRIGAYTGPGRYELKAVTTTGQPDSFPAIEAAGRTFSNGTDSTAVVTVAADGSGSIEAAGLVEQASVQVSNPDPAARIDFSMQWTCQDAK